MGTNFVTTNESTGVNAVLDANGQPFPITIGPLPQSLLRAQAQPNPLLIGTYGDSNFVTGSGATAGPRANLQMRLRATRGDVQFIGTQVNNDLFLYVMQQWNTDAIGGQTIEGLTAALPGMVAATGAPSLALGSIGTNNFADSLATMQTKFRALVAVVNATMPAATKVWSSIVCRTDSGAAVTATQQAFNLWLASYIPTLGVLWNYVNAFGIATPDMLQAGLHLLANGSNAVGAILADQVNALFPQQNGRPYPRPFPPQPPAQVLRLNTPSADGFEAGGSIAGISAPQTGQNFCYSWRQLVEGPPSGAIPFLLSVTDGGSQLIVELNGGGFGNVRVIAGGTTVVAQTIGQLYRMGVWQKWAVAFDATTLTLSLWINAMLVASVQLAGPITFNSNCNSYLGFAIGTGFAGYVANFRLSVGAQVPSFPATNQIAIGQAMEADCFEDQPVPGVVFDFSLNGVTTDSMGNATGSLVGAPTFVNNGPAQPYDFQPAQLPQGVAQVVVAGANVTLTEAQLGASSCPPGTRPCLQIVGTSTASITITLPDGRVAFDVDATGWTPGGFTITFQYATTTKTYAMTTAVCAQLAGNGVSKLYGYLGS